MDFSSFGTQSQLDWTRLDYLNAYPFIQQLYSKPLEKYEGDVNLTILAAQLDLETLAKSKKKPKKFMDKVGLKPTQKKTVSIPNNYLSMDDVPETDLQIQRDLLKNERKKWVKNLDAHLETEVLQIPQPMETTLKNSTTSEKQVPRKNEILRSGCDLQVKINQSRLLHQCLQKWRYKIHTHLHTLHQCLVYNRWRTRHRHWHKWLHRYRVQKAQRYRLFIYFLRVFST
ncbi:hypothetical protein HMI55_004895 [Coelomomyces lativittatus]|nr:hypothetical protein HMI55_004895 [Coelomomyces lativittatus]